MKSYYSKKFLFLFVPILVCLYNIIPKKIRPILLLIASYFIFYIISKKLIIFLMISSFSIYVGGLIMRKIDEKRNALLENCNKDEKKLLKQKYKLKKKIVLIFVILLNFAFLFYFKYLGFFTGIMNDIFEMLKLNITFSISKIIAPIGISFYTLQAISYLLDTYNERIVADKNIIKVFLYLSFFPTIMEGPITNFAEVKDQLCEGKKVSYKSFCFGYQRVLYGLFKKMVIADRLNKFVGLVFSSYMNYSGFTIALGAIFYTILLYMEFSGTMDVVIGIAEIFQIKLPENFKQPFCSKNISEFWSRWHITLGLWFKNYIFYPVSLSKPVKNLSSFVKKKVGNRTSALVMGAIALFAVWSLNGLWHGAGYTFIFFGYYHFALILLGDIFEPTIAKICDKLKINRQSKGYKRFQIMKTAILVFIGELFFRAETLTGAFAMVGRIITYFNIPQFVKEVFTLGMDAPDFVILGIALIIIATISRMREKNINIREKISEKPIILRWTLYYTLILGIIMFGAYGSGYEPVEPIYADF